MRIVVSYRREDSGFGGRLRTDLARWLPCDELLASRSRGGFDALIALIGPDWGVESGDDPVRRSLEDAFRRDARVVVVLLPGASMPIPADLPPSLVRLRDVDPVTASDEYWEPMVGRVVELTRSTPTGSRAALWQQLRRRRLSIAGAVATVGAVVGILSQLGVFAEGQPERGYVDIQRRIANIDRQEYVRVALKSDMPPKTYPAGLGGYAYRVNLRLDHPHDERYGLRWTAVEVSQSKPMPGFNDILWRTYAADEVEGVHPVWVPCPPFDAVPYVVRFELTNESRTGNVRLGSDDSAVVECRVLGE